MSQTATSRFDDVDALAGALFSWCAERSIRLRSQEGVSAAGAVIELFLSGHQTQDDLLAALNHRDGGDLAFAS